MSHSEQIAQKTSFILPGFADGFVIHNRKHPRSHRFKYNMCWCLFDLDDLSAWMGRSRLWQHNRLSVYSLYDTDYVNSEKLPIKEKLTAYIKAQTAQSFNGQVYLFTHPRFFGYGFNSVNFYFCYQYNQLVYIVSEITNTPWGEKHLYLHDCAQGIHEQDSWSFNLNKAFHISPFMEMNMQYQWTFKVTSKQIGIKMAVDKNDVNFLHVVLDTKITPLMDNNVNRFLLKRPFQPWKMSLGIYWQAMKLWLKRTPFYDHPKTLNQKQE